MKFILMMHAPRGTGDYQIGSWSPDDFTAHMAFMHQLNADLTESGEWVDGQGLAPPGEARLVRAGKDGVPDTDGPFPEAKELLALMLLTDARRAARTGSAGELIPLDEQDRALWNRALIAEGVALVEDALTRGRAGPYALQAAVAAVHDEAPRAEDTDWPQILALYGVLEGISANPMVSLNRAVAAAMVHGPGAGLERLARRTRIRGWRGIIGSTPCAGISRSGRATLRRRSPATGPRRHGRRASPSGTISS